MCIVFSQCSPALLWPQDSEVQLQGMFRVQHYLMFLHAGNPAAGRECAKAGVANPTGPACRFSGKAAAFAPGVDVVLLHCRRCRGSRNCRAWPAAGGARQQQHPQRMVGQLWGHGVPAAPHLYCTRPPQRRPHLHFAGLHPAAPTRPHVHSLCESPINGKLEVQQVLAKSDFDVLTEMQRQQSHTFAAARIDVRPCQYWYPTLTMGDTMGPLNPRRKCSARNTATLVAF